MATAGVRQVTTRIHTNSQSLESRLLRTSSRPTILSALPTPLARYTRQQRLYNTKRRYSTNPAPPPPNQFKRSTLILTCAVAVALLSYQVTREVYAESVDDKPEIIVEKSKKKKGASKEENRDLISSQHLQVKKSWENPGVYVWGSNSGKVAGPDSNDAFVRTPRRIPYFDDVLLRDIKLDRQFGAAILENGDLVQWGKAYSEDSEQPVVTLKGKDLKSIAISSDRIIALSKSGNVFSIPVSKLDQVEGPKPSESSWIPFASSSATISYRTLTPSNLSTREKVTSISGGLEHVLLLTSSGRVYSAASSTTAFPSRGQLGVPGITWTTRPAGPIDMCHEITTLKGFNIKALASGDHHSLVLDDAGRVFSFGDNSSGQLGFDYNSEAPFIDAPSLLNTARLYTGTNQLPSVTSISAGGINSFFTIDATRIAGPSEDVSTIPKSVLGKITSDVFACGSGIKGGLGNGKWTHIQSTPTKIPSLSGLFEYDEVARVAIPIRMASISVGSSHASAVMDNVTYLHASQHTSEDDTNWGADIVFWGGNEYYQLGSGKRNNVSTPVYIRPLNMQSEIEAGRREEHRFHITPRHDVRLKGGRKVSMEQRVECGRGVTAVYSGV